jgi:hypothetical protein
MKVTLRIVVWLATFAFTVGIVREALSEPAPVVIEIDCDANPDVCAEIVGTNGL